VVSASRPTRDCVGEQRGHRQQRVAVYWEGRAKRWIYCGTRRGVFDVGQQFEREQADASSVITGLDGAPRILGEAV
jgi:hypothetical protein